MLELPVSHPNCKLFMWYWNNNSHQIRICLKFKHMVWVSSECNFRFGWIAVQWMREDHGPCCCCVATCASKAWKSGDRTSLWWTFPNTIISPVRPSERRTDTSCCRIKNICFFNSDFILLDHIQSDIRMLSSPVWNSCITWFSSKVLVDNNLLLKIFSLEEYFFKTNMNKFVHPYKSLSYTWDTLFIIIDC